MFNGPATGVAPRCRAADFADAAAGERRPGATAVQMDDIRKSCDLFPAPRPAIVDCRAQGRGGDASRSVGIGIVVSSPDGGSITPVCTC